MVRKRVARFLALFLSIGMLTTSVPVSAAEVTTYPVDAEEEIEESTQEEKESEDENSDENEESKKEDSEDNPDSENRETDISDKDSENPEESDVEEDSEAEDKSDEEDLDEPETEQDAEEETPALVELKSSISENGISELTTSEDGFEWNGTTITGYTGEETEITIPAKATAIGEGAFQDNMKITSVAFEENSQLQTIGEAAFYGCTNLETAIIPENVTKIGKVAFCRCDKLSTVVIKSTQDIACDYDPTSGEATFDYCNIKTVNFPEGMIKIPSKLFAGADFAEDGAAITIPASVKEIGAYAFRYARNLTSVDMESCTELTTIGEGAFAGIDITSVIIPENVTNIGEGVFNGCNSLSTVDIRSTKDIKYEHNLTDDNGLSGAFAFCSIEEVKFPEGITKIPAYMFASAGFAENAEITIPASVTEIGNYAFSWTENLTGIKAAEGSKLTTIGDWAFNCSGLKNLKLPESVQRIGADAFAACHSMESAVIPKNVTTIGKSAFNSCSKLASVTIESRNLQPDQFASDSMLFLGCNISTLEFSEGVTTIPAYMFASAGFAENAEIKIPASVTEIGSYAFDNVNNLKKVTIAEGSKLTTIGKSAFRKTAIESIIIPENVTKIGDGAFDECANLSTVDIKSIKNITVDGCGVFVDCPISTVTFPQGMKTIPAYMFKSTPFANDTKITIPASVTEIGREAFGDAKNLTEVTIQEGSQLTKIGHWSFSDTAIESIIIPENVTYIGVCAFNGCANLSTVEIKSKKNITVDGYGMFEGCNISTVKFPEGIKAISAYMFSDAGFASETKLEIPSGVTTINDYAFAWMTGLKSIYIPASVTTIKSTAFKGMEDLEVHCVSGSAAEKWAKNNGYTIVASYGITYNLGGGENSASNPLSYKTGDTLTLSPATRKGYEFAGWYTDKGLQNRIDGEEGGKFTPTDSMGNLTLYAKWILNKYSITYDYNEGQASSKANPSGYDVSKDYILNAPSRAGYAFMGWQVNDTEELITGNKIAKGIYAEDLELTAVWREYAYSLEYNKNAKDAAGTMERAELNYSQEYTIQEEGFSRAGYDFTGWNTRADGKGVSYQPGDEVSGLSAKDKARVILYAQ
ncbi:MAG: leucine-rich repeat protein, partial [Lachnospiraceae bacterium]|nr:leucine-rich repeat protein [Lachnospiraceae bacterium]